MAVNAVSLYQLEEGGGDVLVTLRRCRWRRLRLRPVRSERARPCARPARDRQSFSSIDLWRFKRKTRVMEWPVRTVSMIAEGSTAQRPPELRWLQKLQPDCDSFQTMQVSCKCVLRCVYGTSSFPISGSVFGMRASIWFQHRAPADTHTMHGSPLAVSAENVQQSYMPNR